MCRIGVRETYTRRLLRVNSPRRRHLAILRVLSWHLFGTSLALCALTIQLCYNPSR